MCDAAVQKCGISINMEYVSQYGDWADIRRRVLVEGISQRQILRETGMHWKTLEEDSGTQCAAGLPAGAAPSKEEAGAVCLERIEQILKEDKAMPRKQRHTAKRILERLREEGFTGGYTAVKDAVREMERQRNQEVFVPLAHRPGEAQVDFGDALVRMNGRCARWRFS